MAWGLWNKIKQGFKKVGNFAKKAATFVNDKVIKPFKPMITAVADKFIPGGGKIVEELSDGIDEFAAGRGTEWSKNKISNWSSADSDSVRPAYSSVSEARPYKKLKF